MVRPAGRTPSNLQPTYYYILSVHRYYPLFIPSPCRPRRRSQKSPYAYHSHASQQNHWDRNEIRKANRDYQKYAEVTDGGEAEKDLSRTNNLSDAGMEQTVKDQAEELAFLKKEVR